MTAFATYAARHAVQPLASARNEANRGRRVIGYFGDDVPVELMLAAGALPLRIEATPGPTPHADAYLESSFGPAHRSYLEQWLNGSLDFMDAIVFPRSQDASQRLYYYVCELQRRGACKGPRAHIYDVARVERETSRAHTIAATRALAETLGASPPRLENALQRLRERSSLARKLSSLRAGTPSVAGSDALQAWRALQLDWSESFESMVREWTALAPRIAFAKRFILAGSTPPDDRLHRAIETAGGNVVDEIFDGSSSQCVARWDASEPTLEAIADAYRGARCVDMLLLSSPDLLVNRARTLAAHGVILWLTEQDEGIVWELPGQLERLRAAAIPALALARETWHSNSETLDRIAAFVRETSTP